MQQILNFFIRNKSFLLYLLLFFVALVFTIQSHSYHKSKFINSANFLSGGIYNSVNNVSEYVSLKEQNQLLQEENNKLKTILFNRLEDTEETFIDSSYTGENYKFTPANIIKNSYSNKNNILLLNKGKRDSIKQDLGVVSSKGIVGIVEIAFTKSVIDTHFTTTNSQKVLVVADDAVFTTNVVEVELEVENASSFAVILC